MGFGDNIAQGAAIGLQRTTRLQHWPDSGWPKR